MSPRKFKPLMRPTSNKKVEIYEINTTIYQAYFVLAHSITLKSKLKKNPFHFLLIFTLCSFPLSELGTCTGSANTDWGTAQTPALFIWPSG